MSSSGEIYVRARLKEMGLTIQRQRVRTALETVKDRYPKRKIQRRSYYVRAPLSMLHMDGYHKLIRSIVLQKRMNKLSYFLIIVNDVSM